MDSLNQTTHNPDVLSCLANLSNDEVFTPPKLANEVLNLLPNEVWSNPTITFLDPCCKTGVFLREITLRLIDGLKDEIPNLQKRVNHILTKQVFGIAVTELTTLMTRRTIYCSKNANGKYSICTEFGNNGGNIYYNPKVNHKWKHGKCEVCGASQELWKRADELESHAYAFIHKDMKEIFDMKFDVIIGNPPYQLNDGGGINGSSAAPLYHKFVEQAKKLNPKYISMIIPSRWFAGGKGLDDFRKSMLLDQRICILNDFPNAKDCFPSVDIKGGVCFFLWDRNNKEACTVNTYNNGKISSSKKRFLLEDGLDTFIRYNEAVDILKKVRDSGEISFSTIVSPRKPFGLSTNFKDFSNNEGGNTVKIYGYKKNGYVERSKITKNQELIDTYKLFVPMAIGVGNLRTDKVQAFFSDKGEVCTETYLIIGPFESKEICLNVLSYIETKFFHLLLGLKKVSLSTTSKVYDFIPLQDFTKPWTDQELYERYNLTREEINYIESMIWPIGNKEE